MNKVGTLYIVATPIGNLEDLSFRAARLLKESDFILCEDTRVARKLLDNYNIKTPTISYHQHSGVAKSLKAVELLRSGKNLALVSDAGTPGISDPGGQLVADVRAAFADEAVIESVPGPSALVAAASIAGAGFDRFLFLGFLPHKKGRQTMLKVIATVDYPVIVYESKHRIEKLLSELAVIAKEDGIEFEVSVARELTKMHESFYVGSPIALLDRLRESPLNLKGEFVVLIKKNNFKKGKNKKEA